MRIDSQARENSVAVAIVWDGPTGIFSCLSYNGPGMLAVRWSFLPAATKAFQFEFADFDGNGVLYMVFMDGDERHFFVYNAEATWDGRDANGRKVPAGHYFYQLNADGQHASRRVVQLP